MHVLELHGEGCTWSLSKTERLKPPSSHEHSTVSHLHLEKGTEGGQFLGWYEQGCDH